MKILLENIFILIVFGLAIKYLFSLFFKKKPTGECGTCSSGSCSSCPSASAFSKDK
ncbi:hypothetical protein [Lacihabitans sp. LS3-19]|uniref:hypothetical protein n=1 Tax=Lacihabitans sp. LS3-19 TaxID=2487335 RepID=UPI0020CEB3DC|nr:hypothetical protein [Lacihabitans sp. LS3-19]